MRIPPVTIALLCCVLAVWRPCAAGSSPPPPEQDSGGQGRSTAAKGATETEERFMNEMERLDRKIHELESRAESLSGQLTGLEGERAQLERRLASLRSGSGDFLRGAAARLVNLYKFKTLGYAACVLSAPDIRAAAEAGNLAVNLVENDHRLFLELQKRAAEIQSLQKDIAVKSREAGGLKDRIDECSREIASSKGEKLGLLSRASQQADLYARYSSSLEESQKTLERRAFSRKPVFESRDRPFSSRQGKLPAPAAGNVVETFSATSDATSRSILYSNGIIITAARGESIRAIHEGVVMFADWFREYGKVMIIDHGEHYHSLIAHAGQFLKNTGDVVKAGETVATVGNTGSPSEPKLYFEIRHYGKPVDPREWLALQ